VKLVSFLNELKDPPMQRTFRKEFLKWFEGSQVVDDQGQPLMMFHGTSANEFDEFYPMQHFGSIDASLSILRRQVLNNTNKNSQEVWNKKYIEVLKHLLREERIDFDENFDKYGNWIKYHSLTTSDNILKRIDKIVKEAKGAANFARMAYVRDQKYNLERWEPNPSYELREKTRIVPVFLKITNPRRIEDYGGKHDPLEWIEQLVQQDVITTKIANELDDAMYDIRGQYDFEAEITGNQYAEIAEYLTKTLGIDGFVYENKSEDVGVDSWVPMWNSQIYSAIEAVASNETLGGNWVEQELDKFYSVSEAFSYPQVGLRNYLANPSQDVDPHWWWNVIGPWLDENHPEIVKPWINVEGVDNAEELSPEYWYDLPDAIHKEFESEWGEYITNKTMQHDPASAPTNQHVQDYGMVTKPMWITHFSDDAFSIARKGFEYGIDDPSRLGLTTYLSKTEKENGGYNFGFDSDGKDVENSIWRTKNYRGGYGKEFVMFHTRGVEHVYHYGDEENQYIFWGPDIDHRNIIYIGQGNEDDFAVKVHPSKSGWKGKYSGIDEVYSGTYEEINDWVQKNADQYRKVITGW